MSSATEIKIKIQQNQEVSYSKNLATGRNHQFLWEIDIYIYTCLFINSINSGFCSRVRWQEGTHTQSSPVNIHSLQPSKNTQEMVKKSAENPVSAENPTMSSPIVICHQYPTNPHEISIKSNHFPSAIHSNPHQKNLGEIPSMILHGLAFFPHVLSMQIYKKKAQS